MAVWKLDDILKKKDIPYIMSELSARVAKLNKNKKSFTPAMSVKAFRDTMEELEQIDRALSKLGSYANNWFSENTKNQEAGSLRNHYRALSASVETQLLFISQEWKRFDAKNAQRLMSACPEYAHHLKLIRDGRKHMLSDEVEHVITIKDINGAGALTTIYSLLTTGFAHTLDGKKVEMSELIQHIRSADSAMRKKAYDALFEPYVLHKEVLAELYKHVIDDWRREAEMRKYARPISVRNRANDLPDAAVATLLRVCRKNAPVFQEYFKKKAKLLGKKKLSRYDLYAPLKKNDAKLSWKEAQSTILQTFSDFHPEFYGAASHIIEQEHIHSAVQANKANGAYCNSPAPDVLPYILLSFTEDANSMRTLAHELGHGVHAVLANKQNMFHYDAPLPVCETASIFSELLVNERMKLEKPKLAKQILLTQIDDFYASIMRQAWFVIFEETAHDLVVQHPGVDAMAAVYKKQLAEQFGAALDIPDVFAYEFLYIPHIYHTPFYCYAYSFGNLLSLALFAQYKKNPAFADKIVRFLAKGGSESPEKMVKALGFDLADEKFWQAGFDVIKKMIKEL